MPIMLSKTYAAFKAASVSDAEAEAAAEELAAYRKPPGVDRHGWAAWRAASRVSAESRLVWGEVGREFTSFRGEVRSRFTMRTWALGANLAVTIAILGVLLRLH
jgi:hypothetical protein